MQNPAAYSSVGADVIAKIQSLDMGFLGMDLSGTPNLPWQGGWNWLSSSRCSPVLPRCFLPLFP